MMTQIEMKDIERKIAFVSGLHRSGTSLLFKALRDHPQISGLANTGIREDEGQHLQPIYPTAKQFGGPGRFGFVPEAYLDENSPLVSAANAQQIFDAWAAYWDVSKAVLLEKSPPNLIRSRFLQALFPNAAFVVVLRHPLAVSFATRKWKKIEIGRLVEHWLVCYERFLADQPLLRNSLVLKYEDFVDKPEPVLTDIYGFLGLPPTPLRQNVRQGVNDRYFEMWRKMRRGIFSRFPAQRVIQTYEARVNRFGYSLEQVDVLTPVGQRP